MAERTPFRSWQDAEQVLEDMRPLLDGEWMNRARRLKSARTWEDTLRLQGEMAAIEAIRDAAQRDRNSKAQAGTARFAARERINDA